MLIARERRSLLYIRIPLWLTSVSSKMLASRIFTLCFVLYQAQGAPQYMNLAWLHPTSVMNMQIRPHPNAALYPSQEPVFPVQDIEDSSLMNQPQVNDDEPYLADVNVMEDGPDFMEYRRNQFPQQCDRRKLFQRSSCLNSTYVRTCSIGGIYTDLQCPLNFNCIPSLGICMPQLTRRSQTFSCPDYKGIYPDPRNCMVYHDCLQGNESTPITTTCFWPQIYDPLTQSCQMETPERPCYKINCIGQNQNVAYQGDPNIYAVCSRSGTIQTLKRCEFGLGWIDQTQQCEAHYCSREGNIPANDTNQYYTCSRVFKRLVRSEIKTCSTDNTLIFNATLGICAPPVQPQVESQARNPSVIVETLYHDVPNVTDLVRKVQDVRSQEEPPKPKSTAMMGNQKHLHSSNQQPYLLPFGIPSMSIHDHGTYSHTLPPGLPIPNMMPFLM